MPASEPPLVLSPLVPPSLVLSSLVPVHELCYNRLKGRRAPQGRGNGKLDAVLDNGLTPRIARLCADRGLKMTEPRRVIARVLSESQDHPDVESLHLRVKDVDPSISLATVYRTVKLFEEANIITKRDFGDGRARYEEIQGDEDHHHHLIDVTTGKVIEFHDEELERLKVRIADRLGYSLVDHHLELFGVPVDRVRKAKKS